MPARVVDGAGVWRSNKLKKMSLRFRAEYANLISLAEANGVFDSSPDRVWSDVYSYNRPEMRVEDVTLLLDELEDVDLLRRWSQGGRMWGYWVGIEKAGRLPPASHLSRYKNLPPNAPSEIRNGDCLEGLIQEPPGVIQSSPSRIGLGLDRTGLDWEQKTDTPPTDNQEHEQGETMKAKKEIPVLCLQILGVKAEAYAEVWLRINNYERATSSGQVINEFTEWANLNVHEDFYGKPVSAFLRSLGNSKPTEQKKAAADPTVVNLVRELAFLSGGDVTFDDKAKAGLAQVIAEGNTPAEIIQVFKSDFYPTVQNAELKNLRFAGMDFAQKADQLVYAMRRTRLEREQEAQVVARKAESMVAEAEALRVAQRAVQTQEQEAVEETLGGAE